jgi:hypothetical protein
MNVRHAAALALVGWYLLCSPRFCLANGADEDNCHQGVDVREISDVAMSVARSYGYKTEKMFMEFLGPMHWETLATSKSQAANLHVSQIREWKHELANRCLWSVYFGCEPNHVTIGGSYEGCIDYPPDLWLLIDSETGKILHSFRYTGTDARPRIDE